MGTGTSPTPKVVELQAEVGSLRQDLEKSKSLVRHLSLKRRELEETVDSLKTELKETRAELAEFRQFMHNEDD